MVVDVRARAITAATRLFAAQGFDATSVQAVADEVGVTKQAVLHHFPSKDNLRQAVLDSILAHWHDTLPKLLLASASEDRFDGVFGELHRFFASSPERALVVLREALDRPGEMKKLLRGPVRPWLDAVAGFIDAGRKSGAHYEEVDAEAYVAIVLQMVIATAASAPVMSALIDRERYDREIRRIARASLFSSDRALTRPANNKKKP
jgi:TetR/AcrR family transcriptional regulator